MKPDKSKSMTNEQWEELTKIKEMAELEAVTGGAYADIRDEADAEGRLHNFQDDINDLCPCHNDYKWSRYFIRECTPLGFFEHRYIDIKCYSCKKQWPEWKCRPLV